MTKDVVIRYKEKLRQEYRTSSVNSMLVAVNGFFSWIGWQDCRVKLLKSQHQAFCPKEREMSRTEYFQLLKAAKRKNRRLALLIQTMAVTGIRVSELSFITVEAARAGRAEVNCKGKSRFVFLPAKASKQLLEYAGKIGVKEGSIFVTRNGKPLDRSNVWKEMKGLCEKAGVLASKVFPHNFRHLFARAFYEVDKDISRLADLLGHSSVNTTRIYIISSGEEHARQIASLGLIV